MILLKKHSLIFVVVRAHKAEVHIVSNVWYTQKKMSNMPPSFSEKLHDIFQKHHQAVTLNHN